MATGRFAPSPSGPLHLGNLRTALVAWLFARSAGSRFLVRMEDLDRGSTRDRFVPEQLADLAAIGLDWDGAVVRQSERQELYVAAIDSLRNAELTYPCFCTRREIHDAVRAPQETSPGRMSPEGAYPGTCRELRPAEREARMASGRRPAWRLRTDGQLVRILDRLHGAMEGLVDDFVLCRGDGTPAYNLAVVVDDGAQGIEEVVRGDDLLSSTPRQVHLAQLLAVEPPSYAHVPLLLGPDGNRLAKRHGAVTLADRVAQGERPAAVLARLAVGLGLAEPGEPVTPVLLLERFDPAALPRAPEVPDFLDPP
jgi:glutamyl-tRNA synthetase